MKTPIRVLALVSLLAVTCSLESPLNAAFAPQTPSAMPLDAAPEVDGVLSPVQTLGLQRLSEHSREPPTVLAREGVVRYVTASVLMSVDSRLSPRETAETFLNTYADLFGLSSVGDQIIFDGQTNDETGVVFVRFEQRYEGLSVYGGDMIVSVGPLGEVRSVSGGYVPALAIDTEPSVSRQEAESAAVASVDTTTNSVATEPTLVIFDPAVFGIVSPSGPLLCWYFLVADESSGLASEVIVDAQTGDVISSAPLASTSLSRAVWDAHGGQVSGATRVSEVEMEAGQSTNADAQHAWDHTEGVYEYWRTRFRGRDSYDGGGGSLTSYVHVTGAPCIRQGRQIPDCFCDDNGQGARYTPGLILINEPYVAFCEGSSGPDIVAHEFTHALVDATAQLAHQGDAWALNESYANVFAAMMDRIEEKMWTIWWDEDQSRWPPLRDLRSPAVYPRDYSRPDSADCRSNKRGCADYNSAIPSYAAYLLTVGGTEGGISVRDGGLGRERVEQIYYYTLVNWLPSNATFADAWMATRTACKSMIGYYGITSDDCHQVDCAFEAVGIAPRGNLQCKAAPQPPPTATPTATVAPTVSTARCPTSSIESSVDVGMFAFLLTENAWSQTLLTDPGWDSADSSRLRDSSRRLGELYRYQRVSILEGPVCKDSATWWKVRAGTGPLAGASGWVAEEIRDSHCCGPMKAWLVPASQIEPNDWNGDPEALIRYILADIALGTPTTTYHIGCEGDTYNPYCDIHVQAAAIALRRWAAGVLVLNATVFEQRDGKVVFAGTDMQIGGGEVILGPCDVGEGNAGGPGNPKCAGTVSMPGVTPSPHHETPLPPTVVAPAGSALRQLAFVQSGNIYLVNGDGAALTPLVSDAGYATDLKWSPDGQYISFMAGTGTAEYASRLGVLSIESGETRYLPEVSGYVLAWAPNSRELLVASGGWKGKDWVASLTVFDLHGNEGVPLPTLPPNVVAQNGNWSPDGRQIAVSLVNAESLGGNHPPPPINCYAVITRADGSIHPIGEWGDRNHLLDCLYAGAADAPEWSPAGDWLAYSARHKGRYLYSEAALYLVRADGSQSRILTEPHWQPQVGEFKQVSSLHWSDGQRIYVVANLDKSDQLQIYAVDALSGVATPWARIEEPQWEWDLGPVWSPDDGMFSLSVWIEGVKQLLVYNADGSGRRVLASGTFPDDPSAAVWRP